METTCWSTPATFTWRESDHSSNEFSLLAGADEAAHLSRHGWAGYDAVITTPFGSWEIRSEGFWRPRLIIADRTSGAQIGECKRDWMSGDRAIRWHDGVVYHWHQAGWWSDVFELAGGDGKVILRTSPGNERWSLRNLFRTNGMMEIADPGTDQARLSVLGGLSWLLLLLYREQMASAVVMC